MRFRCGHSYVRENAYIHREGGLPIDGGVTKTRCKTCVQKWWRPLNPKSENYKCGHPRTPENTYVSKRPIYEERICKICAKERARKAHAARALIGLLLLAGCECHPTLEEQMQQFQKQRHDRQVLEEALALKRKNQ